MARITKVELLKLQKKLETDEAIGKKLGITRQAVHQWRKKYGIDSRWELNPDRNKKMSALYKTGKTGSEIAKKFGLSLSQTYRLIGKRKKK
jgi:DNA-directed RNA polymerase specialized sigma subunit